MPPFRTSSIFYAWRGACGGQRPQNQGRPPSLKSHCPPVSMTNRSCNLVFRHSIYHLHHAAFFCLGSRHRSLVLAAKSEFSVGDEHARLTNLTGAKQRARGSAGMAAATAIDALYIKPIGGPAKMLITWREREMGMGG